MRLKRDLEAYRDLGNTCFLPVLTTGEAEGMAWYATPEPAAQGLATRLEATRNAAWSVDRALAVGLRLAESLEVLHGKKLIHGALSPEEIFVGDGGEVSASEPLLGERPWGNDSNPPAGRHASPERVQGEVLGPGSDIYQLGLLLYGLLAGRLPLEDENPFQTMLRRQQEEMPPPSKRNPAVSPALDRIVIRCLRSDRSARYPDGAALAADLAALDPATGKERDAAAAKAAAAPKKLEGLLIPPERKTPSAWRRHLPILGGLVLTIGFLCFVAVLLR